MVSQVQNCPGVCLWGKEEGEPGQGVGTRHGHTRNKGGTRLITKWTDYAHSTKPNKPDLGKTNNAKAKAKEKEKH